MVAAMGTARNLITLAAAVILAFSGCGTICNLADPDPAFYGGIQKDLEIIQTPDALGPAVSAESNREQVAMALIMASAEIGLSAAADTLTLPIVLWMRQD
jgi:uncharacterized protein YceK